MRLRLTELQLRVLTEGILLEDVGPLKWTEDEIKKEASKYNSKVEFQKGSSSAYQTAYKRGMLGEFLRLKYLRMERKLFQSQV